MRDKNEFYMPPRIVKLWEELIEKSIKTGNVVSEKEFFASLRKKERAVQLSKNKAKLLND